MQLILIKTNRFAIFAFVLLTRIPANACLLMNLHYKFSMNSIHFPGWKMSQTLLFVTRSIHVTDFNVTRLLSNGLREIYITNNAFACARVFHCEYLSANASIASNHQQ